MKLRDFIKEFKVSNEPRDEKHYRQLMKDLQQIQNDPKQRHPDTKLAVMKRKAELDAWAQKNLKKEDSVSERMPAQIIKNKQRYANMTDKELADRFKDSDETTLRQMAWRHGYGKMSSYYWDRVQKGKAQTEDGVQPTDLKRIGASGKTVYVHKDGKTIMIPVEREKDFMAKGYKKSALRTEDQQQRQLVDPENEILVQKDGKVITIDKSKEKEYLAKGWTLAEASEDGIDKITMDVPLMIRLLEYAREDAKTDMDLHDVAERLIKASKEDDLLTMKHYDQLVPSKEQTYESDLVMSKQGFVSTLANKIKEPQTGIGKPEFDNRLLAKMYQMLTGHKVDTDGDKFVIHTPAKEQVAEGASMIPYYKTEKDWDGEKRTVWNFPDAWAKNKELDTPYMSNASMRQFLSALGYPADFEDMSAVPIDEFIGVSTQWLKKNIDKQSPEEEPTVDKQPGGPTMISGGRPEGYMNQLVKLHNELARKIKAKYPEVTHVGFN